MLKGYAIFGIVGIYALIPSAHALSWDFCVHEPCTKPMPNGLKLAIGIGCLVLLLLLLISLTVCMVRRRRAAQDKDYDVEESQMSGPPTIIGTQYNPTSGASGIYSAGGFAPQMSGPKLPVSAYRPKDVAHTAPHSQAAFSEQPYPPVYSPRAPKTAFVSGGFASPRPQLAGDRLKERLKERPASETSIAPVSPVDRRRR
jgi:hypothetical protein